MIIKLAKIAITRGNWGSPSDGHVTLSVLSVVVGDRIIRASEPEC